MGTLTIWATSPRVRRTQDSFSRVPFSAGAPNGQGQTVKSQVQGAKCELETSRFPFPGFPAPTERETRNSKPEGVLPKGRRPPSSLRPLESGLGSLISRKAAKYATPQGNSLRVAASDWCAPAGVRARQPDLTQSRQVRNAARGFFVGGGFAYLASWRGIKPPCHHFSATVRLMGTLTIWATRPRVRRTQDSFSRVPFSAGAPNGQGQTVKSQVQSAKCELETSRFPFPGSRLPAERERNVKVRRADSELGFVVRSWVRSTRSWPVRAGFAAAGPWSRAGIRGGGPWRR